MTHTYQLQGMTCGSCVSKVKSQLLMLQDVESADVTLNPPQAVISMQNHISTAALQEAVSKAGHYTIKPDEHDHSHAPMENKNSWLVTYKPLLLLFAFTTGISFIASFNGGFQVMTWMNLFMASFFIAFSFFKFLNLEGFAESYSSYDLLAKRLPVYGYVYPFIELALGIAYLTGFNPVITNTTTIAVMGFSSIGVIQTVLAKQQIQCACLGAVFNLPMSTVTIVEDLLMVGMAGVMLVFVF
ncbi:MAG: heavy metal-associated domain-containing protein [Chitinophagales bacterium]|nr:heavy metal-associated domain-containing protein [Chitinophagales bacterium]